MDFQDLNSRFNLWIWKLDFTVDTARTQKSGIQNIDSVGRHDDLDSLGSLETIKLIQQLQHSPLHF